MLDDKPSRIHSRAVSERIKEGHTIQDWEAVSSERRTAAEASSRWWLILLSIRFLPAQAFEHRHIETTYWPLNSCLLKVASAGPFPWIQSWFLGLEIWPSDISTLIASGVNSLWYQPFLLEDAKGPQSLVLAICGSIRYVGSVLSVCVEDLCGGFLTGAREILDLTSTIASSWFNRTIGAG